MRTLPTVLLAALTGSWAVLVAERMVEPTKGEPATEAKTWAHLAMTGDQSFVGELNELTAWQWLQHAASVK